jgi:ATP synthase protein I
MSGNGNKTITRSTRKTIAAEGRAQGLDIGWTVFGYLAGGMLAYGLIGWLIGRAVHVPLLFPVGMLVGLAISIGYIIYRYGKQGAVEQAQGGYRGDGQSPLYRGVTGGSSPGGSSPGGDKEMTGDR